ncbi:MAG TPA: IPT/TIG domain-containing protein, partial [Gemmatimonadota bacterium]|nr:IPT/TIG domain-containing protein [Gemmatimonadota bacterium]
MDTSILLRTRAITAAGLLVVLSLGCGGGKSVTGTGNSYNGGPSPGSSVASVTVSPAEDSAASIDETVSFSATAKDASGKAVSGATISWSSLDGSVASVSSGGVATARANGTARIVASAGGKADTARLVVKQRTTSVTVSPDSARLETIGDTVRFSGSAEDANGHPVSGVSLAWNVSDSSVATIDTAGLVTARAVGRVEVWAAAAGDTGRSVLRVSTLSAPQIQSVSPSPLQEGQSATITGQGFATSAAGDTVYVDGVAATVSSASSTSLRITVPSYDCLPARSVSVRVATAGGSAQLASSLEPARAAVSLGVGQQAIVTDPAAFCLQFDQSSASQRYLVGVQSLSSTGSSLTSVTLTAEAADGSGAANVITGSLAQRTRASTGGAYPLPSDGSAGQRAAEMRLREWERAHLDPARSLPALRSAGAGPQVRFSISGSASVGDTVAMRVPDAGSSNPCSTYASVTATVQAVGTRAIIVADTAHPANGFTQADYQDLSDRLDNTIFATDVAYFGDPGDLDGNGHIVVVFSKAVNGMSTGVAGSTLLGFVFSGDLYPRTSTTGTYCPSSDEGEVYYGRVPDPNGVYGASSTRTAELQHAPPTMAHELVHLIQNGRRFAAGLGSMDHSMAEAQAVLGQEVVGHATTGRAPYQNYGLDVALNTSGADSFDWYADAV